MNLQRKISILLILVSFLLEGLAFAHSYEGCENLDNKGCWHSINRTQEEVVVDCNQGEFVTRMPADQSYSYQFCPGWGDGLGYPEPNKYYQCSLSFSKGQVVSLAFHTLNWGDRVQILIRNDDVTLHLRAYWNSQVKTYQVPRVW